MARFIILTFAFLGWAFYEMSGGADFEPSKARLTDIREDPLKPTATAAREPVTALESDVTRVALNLTSVEDVLSGGTTQPVRVPEPLPQITAAAVDRAQIPAPQAGESAAIIPSLVQGANATAVVPVAATTEAEPNEIRAVTGTRVNVRGGPGTNYSIVTRLLRGDEVEVLEDDGTGWVRMRPVEGGPVGYVADFLLTEG